jgi:hypothetical protein
MVEMYHFLCNLFVSVMVKIYYYLWNLFAFLSFNGTSLKTPNRKTSCFPFLKAISSKRNSSMWGVAECTL